MWATEPDPVLAELREVSRQAAQAIATEQARDFLLQQSQLRLKDVLQRVVNVVFNLEVSEFTEEQFAFVDADLSEVIGELESYMTNSVEQHDASQLHLLAEALRSLRESRSWIVQGLSPNPTKRPSYEERDRMLKEAEARLLDACVDLK